MLINGYKIYTSSDSIPVLLWNDILNNTQTSFFQTPEAVSFFNSCGIETFTVAVEKNNKLKALVTGIIQKETGLIKSYFTQRAIILGGPIFDEDMIPEEAALLLKELKKILKNRVIFIEVRNFSNYSKYLKIFQENNFDYLPHLNFHVNCKDEKIVNKNISNSKLRQIKKSLKNGAEIVEASSELEIKAFYKILKNLYLTKVKTPLFSESFFLKFFRQKIGKYFLVRFENKIIGGIMCPVFNNRVIYEWFVCGEDGEYKGIYPSILATWAAIDYANKNQIKRFDFMGAGTPDKDYGVREFKSKFGGKLVEYGRFLYVANSFLYWVGKTGVGLLKKIK